MKRIRERLKNGFVPHEGNDHRPKILRWKSVVTVCAIAILAESAFLYGAIHLESHSELFGIVVANTLTDETNSARTSNGLPPLQMNPILQAAAQEKANDMVANNYFAHTSPSGVTPWFWFENVGYNFVYAGENLAVNFSDSDDVTNAWMNSPEHRANILNTNYTQIGIATATGTYEGHSAVYVVEDFGTPAPMSILPVASAASISGTTPVPAPVATSPKPAPANPATAKSSAPITAAQAPAVVAVSSAGQPSSQADAVAIQGAATTAASEVTSTANSPAAAPSPVAQNSAAATPNDASLPQANLVQTFAANPRAALDDFYLLILIFFAGALMINVFVKVRIQYPNLILGGLVTVSLVGIFILLNQQLILGTAVK